MFRTILGTVGKLFAAPKVAKVTARTAGLRVEGLEERAVPTSLAVQLQARKVSDVQLASYEVRVAYTDINNLNQAAARQDLNIAAAAIVDAANVVKAQYQYGYESLAQANSELQVLSSAYAQVQRDLQYVNSYYSTPGPLGGLLSWNGTYAGNLSNYFGGTLGAGY